jgi:hypothetical protein
MSAISVKSGSQETVDQVHSRLLEEVKPQGTPVQDAALKRLMALGLSERLAQNLLKD